MGASTSRTVAAGRCGLHYGEFHSVVQPARDNDPKCEFAALPMVSPRRYVPGYRVLIARNQLTPLELAVLDEAFVLVAVGRNEAGLTLNLRGPVIINLNRRIGRQLITSDEQPLQLALPKIPLPLRKVA